MKAVVEPERTCTGCRGRFPQQQLLRFFAPPGGGAAEAGGVEVDPEGQRGGRGAYACPTRRCIETACRRGALARGLRASLCVSPGALVDRSVAAVRVAGREWLSRLAEDGRARLVDAGPAGRRVPHRGRDEEVVGSTVRTAQPWGRVTGAMFGRDDEVWQVVESRAARRMERIEQLLSRLLGSEVR